MRAREKLLINNGGTVVLGSHSMPHGAMMNPLKTGPVGTISAPNGAILAGSLPVGMSGSGIGPGMMNGNE
jgi:hypothetical protein